MNKIVVVDNASSDIPERLNMEYPSVTLIKNNENTGFAAAVNKAYEYCSAQYLMLLNPDTIMQEGFLDDVINYLNAHKEIGVLGPKIFDDDGSIQGSARSFPSPLTGLFGRNSPVTKLFPKNSITAVNILNLNDDVKAPTAVDWVSGACLIIRKEIVDEIGLLDERFFIYWEDTDLCRRVNDAGFKVVYYPNAEVYHSVGKSSSNNPYFSAYQFHKSGYLLFEKYSKWPGRLFLPLAFWGLALRCLLNFGYNYILKQMSDFEFMPVFKKKGGGEAPKKKKILRVISRLNIGGPAIHVKNLTENIDRKKYDTMLISGSISLKEGDMSYLLDSGSIKKIYIPELQREISPLKDIAALLALIKHIMRYKPDIVDTHTSKAGTLARLAVFLTRLLGLKKIRTVHTFHGHVFHGYFNRLKSRYFILIERLLAIKTDKIIALSDTQEWELSEKYKVANSSKIKKINLGFDLLPFLQTEKLKGQLRQKYGISDDTLLIGIVGRLTPIKNQKLFLDAAKLFIAQVKDIPAKFILIGDGEQREYLENYTKEIGIEKYVEFYGWEKNIPLVYADLDIVALTSLNEGTPVSIIEAMASAVPVITTGVGGVKDLLGGFINESDHMGYRICERGGFCSDSKPSSLANGLIYMIKSGYLSNKERIKNARLYVFENYSIDRLIREMEDLYDSLLLENSNCKGRFREKIMREITSILKY